MRRITRAVVAAAAAGALLLPLAACSPSQTPSSADGPATAPLLTLGQFVEPASFDPATAQEGNYIPYFQPVYDTLIKREPDGSLAPMLATDWEYNDDNTELTLNLRDDVTFTDGAVFDAAAAKANIEYFMGANGPQAQTADFIDSVSAPDDDTLVLELSAPDPALEVSLTRALGFMASPDAIGSDEIASNPVGSGPYTLDTAGTIVGSQYSYVRNESYWGDPLPYDAITIVLLPDETARINALKSGQIDAGVFMSPTSFAELENSKLEVYSQVSDWVGLQFYDRDGVINPAFADVRVREALTVAVDKEAILENVLQGRGELTTQIFSPGGLAYDPALDDGRWDYDPERAAALLADAGHAKDLVVRLPISPAFDPAIYTTIQQNLSDVGVTVERVEYGPGQTIPALTGGQHEVAYMQLALFNDWSMITQAIAPSATWNPLSTEDPAVDALIDRYQTATDDEERQAAGRELNKWLVDNVWFGVFYRTMQTYASNSETTVELQVEQAVPSIYNYAPAS
jgi:peptide/nickel transport system substrate-binding protein